MIKVLYLIHGLSTGGAETLVKEYAIHLDKTKFDLVILCFRHESSPYEKLLEEQGIRVIYISDEMKHWGRPGFIVKIFNHFQLRFLAKKIIHQEKPDIIHYHLPISELVRFSRPARKTRLIFTQHFSIDRWRCEFPKDIRNLKWLMKRYQTQLIALNPKMAEELNTLFSIKNTIILNNGIDMSRYEVPLDKVAKRRELGIPENAFLVVHVGRFTDIKNHAFLVDVFLQLYSKKKEAFLLMVGSGPEEDAVINKLESAGLSKCYLILHNRTDVPEILLSCDCALFPSLSEGLGIAAIEMQAAGLACIASTNVPQTTRISNKIRYMKLSEPPELWADTLISMVDQKVPLELFGRDDWDIRKVVKKLENLYEKGKD